MLVRFVEINSQIGNYFDFCFDTNGSKRCINHVYRGGEVTWVSL